MKKKILSLFLIFCFVSNSFVVSYALADNIDIEEDTESIIYNFKLPVTSTIEDGGWEIVDCNLTGDKFPDGRAYRSQGYGIQVGSNKIDEYMSFDILVTESGYYGIDFSGGNYSGGAIATLSIDENDIGEYDFYDAAGALNGKVEKYSPMFLSEGLHSFVIKVKGKNSGSWGYYMYPGELSLKKQDTMPSLTNIKMTALDNRLEAGQGSKLSVVGYDADEKEYNLDSYVREFTSSDSDVVAVKPDGSIEAVGEGSAAITVSVDINGVSLEDKVTIDVFGVISSIKYDFKDGIDATIEKNGWQIVESNASNSYRNQSYGVQVQSDNVGEYIKIALNVPVDGYYTVKFVGAGAGGGGIVDLLVDDFFVGQFDFYFDGYTPEQPQVVFKTLELNRGTHYLTLRAVGKSKSWGYNMYPSELELERKESLPTIDSINIESDREDVAVGESARLTVKAIMDDGYVDHLRDSDATVNLSSEDESVAVIEDGNVVRGIAPGNSNIIAKVTLNDETKDGKLNIVVNKKVLAEVKAGLKVGDMFVGGEDKIIVEARLDDGSLVDNRDLKLQFTSNDEDTVKVDGDGKVEAIAEGRAKVEVKATLGEVTKIENVEIEVTHIHLTSIDVTVDKEKLFTGRKANVTVMGQLNSGQESNLEDATITYVSSDPEVLEVDNDGVVTAKNPGEANIQVTVVMDGVEVTGESPVIIVEDTSSITNSKTRRTYYTDEKIEAARENISKYDWAKSIKEGAVAEADRYVEDLDFLWNLVPSQCVPRSFLVNEVNDKYICPSCKTDLRAEFSNYPWVIDVVNNPWKLKCPKCGILFPTNDFGAYYESGLDEHGIFDPERADKSLLKNELYEDKGEDWGVDDGYGFVDENGNRHTFIAYYAHWGLWYNSGVIQKALDALSQAYVYTGDIKYARAGIVLLDRVADVYPSMNLESYKPADGFKNSDGGTGGKGKAVGSIWETELVQSFIKAYDAFFDAIEDEGVIGFLREKSAEYDMDNPKDRAALIRKNIEDGILREVYPAVKNAEIRGNFGMHQAALALAAVVLDSQPETGEWLDFTFKPGGFEYNPYRVTGGDILSTLVENVDRDGHGNEAAPGYNTLWLEQLKIVADVLEGYDGYEGADLYENPKFKKMFSSMYPLMLCDRYTAQIGDSGATGSLGLMTNLEHTVKAFEKYGDVELGQLAYFLNNNSTKGIHSDIFTKDPEKIANDIQNIIDTEGILSLKSNNLAGYGFMALRDGSNKKPYAGRMIKFTDMELIEDTAGNKLFANSGTIQFEAEEVGQRLSFKFNISKSDMYEINLMPFKAASYGIYDVYLDGKKISTVDFYGGSGANSKLEVLANMYVEVGEHEIVFEGVGKNEQATNYKMGIIYLMFLDEDAKNIKDDVTNVDTQRDFWMYYGRNTAHGHADTLNLGMHAYGLDIAPDLGYPEATGSHPKRLEWTSNTISHNTVVVNKSEQQSSYTGYPLHFDDGDMVKVMDVDAPKVYNKTSMYRRTLAMIKVDDEISYGVDFFRVKGGDDHRYSFHGAEGDVTVDGLSLIEQSKGTYAGEDTEFGKKPSNDTRNSGFHWLTNVKRDNSPSNKFSVDWKIKDSRQVLPEPMDIHLRLTMLGDFDEVALADGQPPQRPGNPKWLTYMIAKRSGENLESTFTSVIEPYKDDRYIEDIEEVAVKVDGNVAGSDVKAVKVTLKSGRVDYIVSALDKDTLYTVDDKFTFKGILGVYSEKDGKSIYSYINDGTQIGDMADKKASIDGTVVDFTKDFNIQNEIVVETDGKVKVDDIVGRYIYVENDGVRNAVYRIEGVKSQDGNRIVLDIGDTTPIRSFVDVDDFNKGYIYDIKEGAKFSIPLSYEAGGLPVEPTDPVEPVDPIEPEEPSEPEIPEEPVEWVEIEPDEIKITASGHVQGLSAKADKPGAYGDNVFMIGTVGEKRRLEGFTLEFEGLPKDAMLVYKAHVQTYGDIPNKKTSKGKLWKDNNGQIWKKEGAYLGTKGERKRLEGIEVKLINKKTGEEYEGYKVQYQVHMQKFGWGIDDKENDLVHDGKINDSFTKWAENGQFAGTRSQSRRVEAIRIRILKEQVKK